MFTELPDTRVMAMASPMARPVPRTTAAAMPDLALGRRTLKMVWILVAPMARGSSPLLLRHRMQGRDRHIDHRRKDHHRQDDDGGDQICAAGKLVVRRIGKKCDLQLIHQRIQQINSQKAIDH